MPDAVKEGKSRTPAAALETRLVTMSWALRFDRASAANTRLLNTWATPTRLAAGTVQIEAKLKKWIADLPPASLAKPFRFGDLARRTELINETCTIDIEHVDSSVFGAVDDFYAALGSALFKIAVTGMVERTGKHWLVTIDEVGTFLRDTYDFKGSQPLGSWGPTGMSRVAVAASDIEVDWRVDQSWWTREHAYFRVNNGSFQKYRKVFGRGGDLTIFSDVRRVHLPQPLIVLVAV